ncbi:hypothetical protein IQR32_10330 [Acinetobacter albensis]|uniref:hypothetical protein n=1 Tax=Acinetobacter albensis TaxID=1673609 RepID=UPI00187DFB62|nr:hypothetical protein [Acinetobacter albensis]MBE9401730.1 hypothetical protein [Acinetobacter albensis]
MYKKLILGLTLVSVSALVAAKDENYGCRAFMCFAGGLNISECQSTISDVKKDLAKGKGFPHCSFVSGNKDGSMGGSDGQSKISSYTHNKRVYLYVDDKLVTSVKKS